MEQKLYLIDGSSYIFRAFYGVRPGLSSPGGLPTNAIFGFKNLLLSLLKTHRPSHLVMVFDTPGPCFRNRLYPDYKANRSPPPDDLKVQFEPIFELTRRLNIPILTHDDFEADDVIATLAKKFAPQIPVVVVSGDKDLAQLVGERVLMYDGMKDQLYTPKEVKEKWGVGPEMIVQYLALVGDASDNIPGAAGIGPKTALALFEKYGDIQGIYDHLGELKGKQKENLENSRANVDLSLQLTQVSYEVPLEIELDQMVRQTPEVEGLKDFYRQMGFRSDSFLEAAQSGAAPAELGQKTAVPAPPPPSKASNWNYGRYRLVTTLEQLDLVIQELRACPRAALDFETTSLAAERAEVVGISLAWSGGDPVYLPCAHQTTEPQIPAQEALARLKPLFEDPNREWVVQNVKYELMVLQHYGLDLKGQLQDSMIASYVLDVDLHRHNLDDLSQLFLGHEMIHFEDLCGKGKTQIPFSQVPVAQALDYGAEDAEVALLVFGLLEPKLKESGLWELYLHLELPLARCLAKMEFEGVLIDLPTLAVIQAGLEQDLVVLEKRIYELAGHEFNLNSTQQLGVVLYEEMGIEEGKKKTKTGFSTDASVLEALAPTYEIASKLLEYRTKTKLINTYLSPLPELVSPKDGRVHTHFSQVTAATGRLSSKNPNLQNIPIKGEEGKRIRSAFVAPPEMVLVSADYSQIELRFLAHLCEDPALIQVFGGDRDIHTETAAAIFHLEPGQVSSDQRRAAKAINFGIIYGMGAFRLAKEIGVGNAEAKRFIDAYFARYPKIQAYMEETLTFAREKGYVETLFGRRRPIFEINSKNHLARTGAERAAINSRIQGSAADLIKRAMIDCQREIDRGELKAKMILQVHDELLFEVDRSLVENEVPKIKRLMESAAQLKVPLRVDAGWGLNWGLAH